MKPSDLKVKLFKINSMNYLKLKKDMPIDSLSVIKAETILNTETWRQLIGREGNIPVPLFGSDAEWWEVVKTPKDLMIENLFREIESALKNHNEKYPKNPICFEQVLTYLRRNKKHEGQ